LASCAVDAYNRDVSTVEEIKAAIEKLSLSERGQLERWLHEWADDAWDQQMAQDARAGRLDRLIDEVDEEIDSDQLRDAP
jgi:hypothetical protein